MPKPFDPHLYESNNPKPKSMATIPHAHSHFYQEKLPGKKHSETGRYRLVTWCGTCGKKIADSELESP